MFCVDLLYSFLFFFYRMQHSIKVFTRFIYLHFFIIFYVYSICRFVLVLRLCIGDKKVVVSTSIHKALLITFINIYNVNIMHHSDWLSFFHSQRVVKVSHKIEDVVLCWPPVQFLIFEEYKSLKMSVVFLNDLLYLFDVDPN